MTSARRFRQFDLGDKSIDGIFDRSIVGAFVTIASVTLMTVLFVSELRMFFTVHTSSHMAVADFHEHDAVTVHLHATFPFIECSDLEIAADNPNGGLDNSQATKVDIRPASKADRRPFQKKDRSTGCTLDGTVEVERAAGSIIVHVINHDPSRLIAMGNFIMTGRGEKRTGPNAVAAPNITHKIHDFGFGPTSVGSSARTGNPLTQTTFLADQGSGLVKYTLKVVPTSHTYVSGREVKAHTYSANVAFVPEEDSKRMSNLILGVQISYDFTPVMVRYTHSRRSIFEFVTSICAIIGGIYTVSGLFVRGVGGVSAKKHD